MKPLVWLVSGLFGSFVVGIIIAAFCWAAWTVVHAVGSTPFPLLSWETIKVTVALLVLLSIGGARK